MSGTGPRGDVTSTTAASPILLVEHDEQRRALIGGWLQDAGYDVLTYPGPSAPEIFVYRQSRG